MSCPVLDSSISPLYLFSLEFSHPCSLVLSAPGYTALISSTGLGGISTSDNCCGLCRLQGAQRFLGIVRDKLVAAGTSTITNLNEHI